MVEHGYSCTAPGCEGRSEQNNRQYHPLVERESPHTHLREEIITKVNPWSQLPRHMQRADVDDA